MIMGEKFDGAQPAPRPSDLSLPKAKRGAWAILCVMPLMERKVAEVLRDVLKLQVYVPIETYLPKTANVARSHKPWRPRTRPVIPGVIFALLDSDEAIDRARKNDAVRRILCSNDGRPVAVPAIDIGSMILFEAWGAYDSTRKVSGARSGRRRGKRGVGDPESRWKSGQRVKIGDGAFAGFIGTVLRADRDDRIEVLISIFGRETPVQLDERDIAEEGE